MNTQNPVLLVAYQCGPGMGSVSQIGWAWFTGMAARRAVCLVTHVRNRAAIEAAPDRPAGARVIYIDTEWFAGRLYRLARRLFPRSEHAVFMVSQIDWFLFDAVALRTLRRERAAGAAWRLLHLVTPVTVSAPTALALDLARQAGLYLASLGGGGVVEPRQRERDDGVHPEVVPRHHRGTYDLMLLVRRHAGENPSTIYPPLQFRRFHIHKISTGYNLVRCRREPQIARNGQRRYGMIACHHNGRDTRCFRRGNSLTHIGSQRINHRNQAEDPYAGRVRGVHLAIQVRLSIALGKHEYSIALRRQ